MTVPPDVVNAIEVTINSLSTKQFEPDPIAGSLFSKITSVMSSAYKRHGLIIESALLQAVDSLPNYTAWRDDAFEVNNAADNLATSYMASPEWAIGTHLPVGPDKTRTLQIDLAAYNSATQHFSLYEVKRGSGAHDSGKKRQMRRDLVCMEVLAKAYAEARGFTVNSSSAHMVFYYGKCSVGKPFALTKDDLDSHFGAGTEQAVEDANALFKLRLFEILTA